MVNVGVTVIVAVIAWLVLFVVKAKLGMPEEFPLLEAASPIAGVSFVQVKVVVPPVFAVEKVIGEVLAP